MSNWIISDEGEEWSVKLDVRDLRGHLDSTQRQRASTPAAWVVIVLCGVLAFCALPLDSQEKLRILRTIFVHAALHGVEASLCLLKAA